MIPAWIRDLDGENPYEVLSVTRTADQKAVTKAYHKLIRVVHPDLPGGDEHRAKLAHLSRDILLDPSKRREYNRYADTGVSDAPASSSAWDEDDVTDGVINSPVWTVDYSWESPPTPSPQDKPASQLGIGLAALIGSLLCSPAGLVIAIVALSGRARSKADRACAWFGVLAGLLQIAFCGIYLPAMLDAM